MLSEKFRKARSRKGKGLSFQRAAVSYAEFKRGLAIPQTVVSRERSKKGESVLPSPRIYALLRFLIVQKTGFLHEYEILIHRP